MSEERPAQRPNRRITILGGLIVLQLVLLISAFSLGVYFERYGLIGGAGGGLDDDVPPPGEDAGPPADILPPCLPTEPELMGFLREKQDGTLRLRNPDGNHTVRVNASTIYLNCELDPLTLNDLEIGWALGVYGTFDDDGTLTVTQIIVISPE